MDGLLHLLAVVYMIVMGTTNKPTKMTIRQNQAINLLQCMRICEAWAELGGKCSEEQNLARMARWKPFLETLQNGC